MHIADRAANYGKNRINEGIYCKKPHGFVIDSLIRKRKKPQNHHKRRYYHMKIHLNKTAHCVVGIAPLKRRCKSHRDACRVNEPRHQNIRRCHCADKRIVRNLFCAFNSKRGKTCTNEIDVHEYVRLNRKKRQDIKFAVVHGAEFFVVFEFVITKSVDDNQKSENAQNHEQRSERLVFGKFTLFVHNRPLSLQRIATESQYKYKTILTLNYKKSISTAV